MLYCIYKLGQRANDMIFISKTIKYVIVYPVVGIFVAYAGLIVTGKTLTALVEYEPKSHYSNEAKVTPSVVIAESKPTETYKHQQCRLDLHKENPYGGTYNGLSNLVWDTSAFGTYEDGDVWVGYNRKVGDKVFYNMRKIC
jgi:hypothetical protein